MSGPRKEGRKGGRRGDIWIEKGKNKRFPLANMLQISILLSSPANIAVVSLAFGRYLIEPLFAPCHAPALAVKLVTTTGICE